MNYEIKELTKDSLQELVKLEQACFEHPWTEAMFQGDLDNPLTVYYGAFFGKAPVGYIGMWCVADEGQITNVAVHPDYRRQGLAQQLIGKLLAVAKEKQLACLTLEVREHNEKAICLYEKMGFLTVGRRKGYYEGKEDALLMTLFLEENEGEKNFE